MKLIRLKINSTNGFRSLPKGFEINFHGKVGDTINENFYPYILAGKNGSGKSNILEALAEIFYHLDCIYLSNKPDYFDKSPENKDGFDPRFSTVGAYEIEYKTLLDPEQFYLVKKESLNLQAHIKIFKKSRKRPVVEWVNEDKFRTTSSPLSQHQIKAILPEYVVGYASGHNETLSIPFFKSRFLQYDEYLSKLDIDESTSPKREASLVYLDNSYSQAIFLSNLLMQENKSALEGILDPFRHYVKLIDIDSFRIIIRTDKIVNPHETNKDLVQRGMDTPVNILRSISKDTDTSAVFVTSYIEKLKRCASSWEEVDNSNELILNPEDSITLGKPSYLILDYQVNEATKKAFQFHFEDKPLKLFELFQLLLVLDNYEITVEEKQRTFNSKNVFVKNDLQRKPIEEERILRFKDFLIKKEDIKKSIYTKNLSDGEHQFLHTLGLCLLFKDTRCLFLLDEPETHFNPSWKAKYVSSIVKSFKKQSNNRPVLRDMFISTHSPFLISDCQPENVLFFSRNSKTNKVESSSAHKLRINTYGTSVEIIMDVLFGYNQSIGDLAKNELRKIKYENINNHEDIENIKLSLEHLGHSIEKDMVFARLNRIAKKMKK